MARLLDRYRKEIVGKLQKKLNRGKMCTESPARLRKIVVQHGRGQSFCQEKIGRSRRPTT